VHCVSDYCQILWHMYSGIRSEARRPDVKWHLYIRPGDFLCGPILCEKYISYIFHVFSEARDHILILNILFFNKLRQVIPEVRSEMRDLLIFWSPIRTFKMCIASANLVTGSVICFHFIFCSYYVFVYLTCVRRFQNCWIRT
jgi:hypothetical protein